MRIRIAPPARSDLDAIWFYIAQESGNVEAATRVVSAITDKFALLAQFPFIGRSLEASERANVRTFPANRYTIFYSTRVDEIRVLRIIHSSRDAQLIFGA
jgi:plasmid stabilization system protein ParE